MSVQECSICLCDYSADSKLEGEENKTPLLLSCGHTFCHSCLVDIYDEDKAHFECPTCRSPTPAVQGVKDLKANFALLEMLSLLNESKKKSKKSDTPLTEVGEDGKDGVVCCECEKNNATLYCSSCEENYCVNCSQTTHQASKALSKHRPRPISLQTVTKCLDHNEPIKLLCRTDQTPICALCTHKDYGTTHQGHETVLLKTAAQEIQNSVATLLAKGDSAVQTLSDTAESLTTTISKLTINAEIASKQVSKEIEDLIQSLRNREAELLSEISKEEQLKKGKLLSQKEVIQGRITNLGKQCEQLREYLGHDLNEDDFSMTIAQLKLLKTLGHDLDIKYEELPLIESEILVTLPEILPPIVSFGTVGPPLPVLVSNIRTTTTSIFLAWEGAVSWLEFQLEMRTVPEIKYSSLSDVKALSEVSEEGKDTKIQSDSKLYKPKDWVPVPGLPSPCTTKRIEVRNLVPSTGYQFRLKGLDYRGWSIWNEIKTFITEDEKAQTTAHSHILTHKIGWPNRPTGEWLCDICQENYKRINFSWHCDFCGFDLCDTCFPKYVTSGSSSSTSRLLSTLATPPKPVPRASSPEIPSSPPPPVDQGGDSKTKMTTIHPHGLTLKVAYDKTQIWHCDKCDSSHAYKEPSWHCAPCGYDLCGPCYAKYATNPPPSTSIFSWAKQALLPTSPSTTGPTMSPQHPHPLNYIVPYPKKRIGSWQCDICTTTHRPSTKSWHCEECGYDLCVSCFSKYNGTK